MFDYQFQRQLEHHEDHQLSYQARTDKYLYCFLAYTYQHSQNTYYPYVSFLSHLCTHYNIGQTPCDDLGFPTHLITSCLSILTRKTTWTITLNSHCSCCRLNVTLLSSFYPYHWSVMLKVVPPLSVVY